MIALFSRRRPNAWAATLLLLCCAGAFCKIGWSQESAKSAASNSIGIEFLQIPSGRYRRGFGANRGADHRFKLAHPYSNSQDFRNETPSHNVVLTKAFEIGATEVSVAQFKAFVAASGYVTDAEKGGGALGWFPQEKNYVDRFHKDPKITWKNPGFKQTDKHPVVAVSWNDANAFCKWLSNKEDRVYRLPSEAEWEYACRAGSESWYAWGENPDAAYAHANVADGSLEAAFPYTTQFQRAVKLGADEGDGAVFTSATGSYQPNAWGLRDMQGNVWEWCQDRWAADCYRRLVKNVARKDLPEFVVHDPVFLAETDQHKFGDWRVMRGGAWTCAPAAVRCSIRTFAESADAAVYTGFRVVRESR